MKSIKIPKVILHEFVMHLNISEKFLELDYLNNNYIFNSGGFMKIVSLHKGNKIFGTMIFRSCGI